LVEQVPSLAAFLACGARLGPVAALTLVGAAGATWANVAQPVAAFLAGCQPCGVHRHWPVERRGPTSSRAELSQGTCCAVRMALAIIRCIASVPTSAFKNGQN